MFTFSGLKSEEKASPRCGAWIHFPTPFARRNSLQKANSLKSRVSFQKPSMFTGWFLSMKHRTSMTDTLSVKSRRSSSSSAFNYDLNGAPLLCLQVEYAAQKLNGRVTEHNLMDLFDCFGEISSCTIDEDSVEELFGPPSGIAYIFFKDVNDTYEAANAMCSATTIAYVTYSCQAVYKETPSPKNYGFKKNENNSKHFYGDDTPGFIRNVSEEFDPNNTDIIQIQRQVKFENSNSFKFDM